MNAIFTSEALATGEGRNGHVRSGDGYLDTDLKIPTEMGGPGGGLNPETLFAAGYAACYHSALMSVARQEKTQLIDSSVGARVSLVNNPSGSGYSIAVELEVVIPHLSADDAKRLADAAHQICPYSNATRGNIEVTITVADD